MDKCKTFLYREKLYLATLFRELGRSIKVGFLPQHLNLECTLHLLYLVTPYDVVADIKPQWMTYFDTVTGLDPIEIKAAELIGMDGRNVVSIWFLSRQNFVSTFE